MHRALKRFAKQYEEKEDLALALIAEGMELLQTLYFNEAALLEEIKVEINEEDEEGGYIISVSTKELIGEYEDSSHQE